MRLGDRRDVVTKWEVSWVQEPNDVEMGCTGFETADAALDYATRLPPGCRRRELVLVTRERFGIAG